MKLILLDAVQAKFEEAQACYLQHATPGIATTFAADYENGVRQLLQFPQAGTSISHACDSCRCVT